MTPTLRPYQSEAVERLRAAFRQGHHRVLFVLPTGGGKTVVFSYITQQAATRGRVCVLVHRQELLRQASASLTAMGVAHGCIQAGQPLDLSAAVQVASVQTLARRLQQIPPDWFTLLIVDEAHHTNAGTWARVLEHCSVARVLGVTATPVRGDGRGLGEYYQTMVIGPSPAWLTDHGFLAAARVFTPPLGVELKGLRRRMGDYDMQQAGEMMSATKVVGDAFAHYRQHLDGQTAIAFCCSVAHAVAVAELFQGNGVAAASIDGTMSSEQRAELLTELGAGRLKVLTSCQLIGEGVDVPSVGGCILLRPTQSEALHLQMIGRCLRPQAGKRAVVLDHVGNVRRLGHHLEERQWTLDGVRKRAGERAESVRECPACFAALPAGTQVCSECGHEFQVQVRELEHVDGELQEVQRQAAQRERRMEQGQAQTLEQLIDVGRRRGMKNPRGWARHVLAARQAKGQWSRVA